MYKDFSYHIMSANSAFHPQENEIRNQIFAAWHKVWSEVYRESNTEYELVSDDFTRQEYVTAIFHKNEVAAVHLYSFFHLDSNPDLKTKYFHFFSETYLNHLRARKVKTVMSMEYLTVLPEFRKSKVGFSFGPVLGQLGIEIFGELQIDAIIAPARNDVGVNKMAYDFGFSCLEKDTEQRGFTCDMIACLQGQQKPSATKETRECARFLWEGKKIYLPDGQLRAPEQRIALPKVS